MSTVEQHHTHSIDSKEAVLDAAQRLINQYGYSGFSMRDLAQQSGLAKATLYHHFEDKREIFLQVLERDLVNVSNRVTAAATTQGDLATRLHKIAMTFFEVTQERGGILLSTLRQAAGMEEEFCLLMRRGRDQLHLPIVELLANAMAEGTIRTVDAELATTSFFGIIQALTSRRLLMEDIELNEKTADFVIDFVLNGLLSTPSREQS